MAKAKKLPSGNWRVQAQVTIDGRVIRKSFVDTDRRRAELAAVTWQTGQQRESLDDITLARAYERFLEAKGNVLSPATVRGYQNLMNNSLQDIMYMRVSKLSNELIQRAINIYAASHSPKSVKNCYGLLTAVLSMFAPDMKLHIKLPQKKVTEMYIPTDEDIQALLSCAKGTNYYVPILLGAFGGMREGEICALTSDDIKGNFATINKSMVYGPDKKWSIKPPKNFSSNRSVELPDFVINALTGIDGKIVVYNPHSLSTGFRKILINNNLPRFRFHDLRHYYVSSLHALNIPDKYIMAQGGWATNHTMQNVYNHIISNQQSKFSKQITEHFNNIFTNEDDRSESK